MIDAGDDPERDSHECREQEGSECQFERCRQPLPDVEPDRPVRVLALAKVEPKDLADIDKQLLDDRAVKPVLVTDGGDLLRGGIVAGKRRSRIGWHNPDQKEGDNQQPE